MTPEEFERIKQAEKQHLRELKKLKEQLRAAQRMQTINRALKDMQDAPGEDILRTHEEMMERLGMETATREAKLDMALSSEAAEPPAAGEEVDEEALRLAEEALERERARSLVRQVKIEMGLPVDPTKQDPSSNVAPRQEPAADSVHPPNPSPRPSTDKTIGRLRK